MQAASKLQVRAISLIEVVIAIGVVGFVLTAGLGMLASITQSVAQGRDRELAERAAREIISIVESLSYDSVVPAKLLSSDDSGTLERSFFADARMQSIGTATEVPSDRRYFCISLERDADINPGSDSRVYYAAVQVRVEWPWAADVGTRSVIRIPHVIMRQ